MSLGELCIAPVVQSQATMLAPANLRGFIMGIVMLSLAFSNLAGVILSKFMSVPSVGGKVDIVESLAIYKSGFLNITFFNLGYSGRIFSVFNFLTQNFIKAKYLMG